MCYMYNMQATFDREHQKVDEAWVEKKKREKGTAIKWTQTHTSNPITIFSLNKEYNVKRSRQSGTKY